MAHGWITPDDPPASTRTIRLTIPAGQGWESCIRGALLALLDPANWEQVDANALTAEETAATMDEIIDPSIAAWEDC
jgi:hypothetical protein